MALISGIAHVNLTVPPGTLDHAAEFYGKTLGLRQTPVPQTQRDRLAWFNISQSGQQIHIAFGHPDPTPSSRHPCFKIDSPENLLELRKRVYEHFDRGGDAAPKEADKPGKEDSGEKGAEYPTRFFARDYAGNRLEFSL
ncbi:related to glyoxalase family protein [Rhynchosporium graminicola]|uniref:Related to glyoxalase family protein n=1 Tax=Rhynchosporium graminicola TaxID=2792576 RepID=A0A1E1LST8_9HELO|nr:related to glyoxalase family protein [Rhynchosporium commune]